MGRSFRIVIASLLLLLSNSAFAELINLNAATAESLASGLVGVGPVKAEAIVTYRNQHGGFSSLDELLQVKGIGSSILNANRENLSLGEGAKDKVN